MNHLAFSLITENACTGQTLRENIGFIAGWLNCICVAQIQCLSCGTFLQPRTTSDRREERVANEKSRAVEIGPPRYGRECGCHTHNRDHIILLTPADTCQLMREPIHQTALLSGSLISCTAHAQIPAFADGIRRGSYLQTPKSGIPRDGLNYSLLLGSTVISF